MRNRHYDRTILASVTLALMVLAPPNLFAQRSNEPPATFTERFSGEETSAQAAPEAREANQKQKNVARTTRVASARRARSRVVVVPRSFLDAGTEVRPGQRKYLDYAFSPIHTAMDVVTNAGGRVGWHNSPLPGPLPPH
jgi:hypothetical protein